MFQQGGRITEFDKVTWPKSDNDNFDFLDVNCALRWLNNTLRWLTKSFQNNHSLCLASSKQQAKSRLGSLGALITWLAVIAEATRIINYKQLWCLRLVFLLAFKFQFLKSNFFFFWDLLDAEHNVSRQFFLVPSNSFNHLWINGRVNLQMLGFQYNVFVITNMNVIVWIRVQLTINTASNTILIILIITTKETVKNHQISNSWVRSWATRSNNRSYKRDCYERQGCRKHLERPLFKMSSLFWWRVTHWKLVRVALSYSAHS